MKKFIVLVIVFLAPLVLLKAQDLHYLAWDDLRQHNPMLPAQMKQDTGWTIVLPAVSFTAHHSGPAIGAYFLEQSTGVYSLDFSGVLDEFDELNDMQFQFKLPLIGADLRRGHNMFSIAYGVTAQSALSFTKDFINLYQLGNAAYIGETMDLTHQLSMSSYHELQLGYARAIGGFNIGARFKIISGISNISTPVNDLGLYTDPDIYQLSLIAPEGVVFNTSGGLEYNGIDDISVDFKTIAFNNLGKNLGYGLDVGIYGQTGKITYAASLLDIGKINWNVDSKQYKSNSETLYEGLDLLDFFDDSNDRVVEDSLKALLELEELANNYSTNLRFRANAMVGYQVSTKYSAALFYNLNSSQGNFSSYGLINKFHFGKSQANLMISSVSGKFHVGLGGMFSAGPIQLLVSADNIVALIDPDKSNYASARLGVNLSF